MTWCVNGAGRRRLVERIRFAGRSNESSEPAEKRRTSLKDKLLMGMSYAGTNCVYGRI
jgi:hypothetical protein